MGQWDADGGTWRHKTAGREAAPRVFAQRRFGRDEVGGHGPESLEERIPSVYSGEAITLTLPSPFARARVEIPEKRPSCVLES
jgi:hypothetical protein